MSVLSSIYPWVKAAHLLVVITWMAALLYVPRLYVYHCGTVPGSAESERFKVMERGLLQHIATPAMVATWLFGLTLAFTPGILDWSWGWWHVKLAAVILMSGFHGAVSRWRRDFLNDRNRHPAGFYRLAHHVPTVLLVVIIIMVIVRPF